MNGGPQGPPQHLCIGGQFNNLARFNRKVSGQVDLHRHPGEAWLDHHFSVIGDRLEEMDRFPFHRSGVDMIDKLSRHGGERELDASSTVCSTMPLWPAFIAP